MSVAKLEKPKWTHTPWSIRDCVAPLDARLEPELLGADFFTINNSVEVQEAERIRCELSPWHWLANYVVTVDERWLGKGLKGPYQRFPSRQSLRSYAHVLFTEMHTAWPKSRQQMITWLCVTMALGESLFAGARLVLIQSKRWEDSKKALKRARGVFVRLRDMAPWLVPELVKDDVAEIGFSNDSTMMAVPCGENYVQSNTPSHWICDEAQLQDPSTKLAFEQALPAVDRITLVGSADYSWFWQVLLQGKQE